MKIELSALAALALVAAVVNTSPLAAPVDIRPADGGPLGEPGDASTDCADRIKIAPVLQMTQAGYTLSGPILRSLQVDSSGLVILSERNPAGGGSSARMLQVGPERARALSEGLQALDASSLCDASQQVFDMPLTTVTVHSGGADSAAHSYSYWIAEEGQRDVEAMITRFVSDALQGDAQPRPR